MLSTVKLHASLGAGVTWPTQEPHELPVALATHVCVPAVQVPTPSVPAGPV